MENILISNLVNKLNRKKEKSLVFYSLITALWLVISIFILVISTRKYIINLILNIFITIVFGFFSVFYFTIILKNINEKKKLIKKVDNGIINKEYAYYDKLLTIKEDNDFIIFVYNFKTLDGKDRKLLSFTNIEKSNKRLYIESKLDYIISFKVLDDE